MLEEPTERGWGPVFMFVNEEGGLHDSNNYSHLRRPTLTLYF